jgi:3-methylcrotonyl-CoA carboxylase alpha subunit
MFNKILIANRGEIACRVIDTARRMGVRTVAVYSDADAKSRHVAMADEAVHIGPAEAAQSYLVADKILAAAKATGAQAVHPGYGFLSENAGFAERLAADGIVFIGPPADAIRAMGSKSEAKKIMQAAQVPLVPGYHGDDQGEATLRQAAADCGYPVLIKASAGGGGKGMRVVESDEEFSAQLAAAKREALAAFGDEHVLIEKYLRQPRHIEIQVFCDSHGGAVYLFERDCSVQRRHQKVLEEAPAPGMTEERRREMGEAAIAAAQAIGYVGAGTVEFIVDQRGDFFFMEMNTRLQVEHPVTELISGQDLVEWQLRVAAGEPLPKTQEQLMICGHAIEARIYAEDPHNQFLPATGTLHHLQFPEASAHVRVDTGVRSGDAVSIHYDPMIAKLIVWDENRAAALRRMHRALRETQIVGLANNVDFLDRVIRHPAFAGGEFDTGFIDRHRNEVFLETPADHALLCQLATLFVLAERQHDAGAVEPNSPWSLADSWQMNLPARDLLQLADADGEISEIVVTHRSGGFALTIGDASVDASASLDGSTLTAVIDGQQSRASVVRHGNEIHVFSDQLSAALTLVDPTAQSADSGGAAGGLTAPMPGKVVQVLVEAGATVKAGQALIVLEAMKMEHTISAPTDGVVSEIRFAAGELVEDGAALLVLDSD